MRINIPKIDSNNYVQLCFIRKYRQTDKTRYMFFSIDTSKPVANDLKKLLMDNISRCKKTKNIKSYNPSINSTDLEALNLSTVYNWSFFDKKAFLDNTNNISLKDIKRQLVGFLVYVKTKNSIIGQIRKITPSSVLESKGLYKMFFDGRKFNEIKEDIGLQIDNKADIVFVKKKISTEAIIINKDNFKSIFDVYEQEKKEAVDIFKNVDILHSSQNSKMIQTFIESSRQLQKMIINPVVREFVSKFNFKILIKLKKEVPEKVSYEIDDKNNDFILPEGKEKQALKDIIKAMVGKYNQDLEGKHIYENAGVKKVLK